MPRVPALFVHVYLPGCKCNYREGGRGGWWVVRVEGGGVCNGRPAVPRSSLHMCI